MNVATLAVALIRVFEGCKLEAYQDTGGVWTIGLGHTAGVKEGDIITMDQAAVMFQHDAAPLFQMVEFQPMLSGAAHVSFGYNCGRTALSLVLLEQAKLSTYVHDRHGNIQPGLVSRRALEQALIDSVAPLSA
jgi:lysozyme